MAVTHNATLRNTFATAVYNAIDTDSLAGNLIFKEGGTTVATLVLDYPVGTAPVAERLTFDPINSDTNAVGGTIDNFVITDNSSNTVLSGSVTVTGGGGDITLSSVVIPASSTVSMTSLYYDASP